MQYISILKRLLAQMVDEAETLVPSQRHWLWRSTAILLVLGGVVVVASGAFVVAMAMLVWQCVLKVILFGRAHPPFVAAICLFAVMPAILAGLATLLLTPLLVQYLYPLAVERGMAGLGWAVCTLWPTAVTVVGYYFALGNRKKLCLQRLKAEVEKMREIHS